MTTKFYWTFLIATLLLSASFVHAEETKSTTMNASGEVVSVDPVYSQVTIEHGAIKDFSGSGQTEFYVTSPDILKGLTRHDLVDFELTDNKGDVRISKIEKTGVAEPKDDRLMLGQALQETLSGAGEVARTVTSPIPPASEAVGGAFDATADASGNALKDATPEQKTDF